MKRPRRICIWLWILVLAIQLFPMGALAASNGEKIVRVGYETYPNYEEGGPGEYKRGYGYEYLQKIAYRTGWKYEYVYGSFPELLEKLETGEIDLMGNITPTPERLQKFLFSNYPQGEESFGIYTLPGSAKVIARMPVSLRGQRIGFIDSQFQQELLEKWKEMQQLDSTIIPFNGMMDMLDALEKGEIDAIMDTDTSLGMGYVLVAELGRELFYFGVSKNRPELMFDLNRAMGDILARDPFFNQTIYAKYNSTDVFLNENISSREMLWLDAHDWKIRVGYLEGNLPYVDSDSGGQVRGVLNAIFDRMTQRGIHFEYRAFPSIDSLSSAMDNHMVDLAVPMFRDYWFAEFRDVIMTDPVAATTMALIYRDETPDFIPQEAAVAEDSAIQRGYCGQYLPEVTQTIYPDLSKCLEAVAQGNIQCTLVPATTYNLYRNGKGMDGLRYRELPNILEICFYAHREDMDLVTLMDKNIALSLDQMQGFALSEYSYSAPSYTLVEMVRRNAVPVLTGLLVVLIVLGVSIVTFRVSLRKVETISRDNAALSAHAYKDGLTGVGNRFSFLSKRAEMEKEVIAGKCVPFGVVIVDVNNLKGTNDHWGHESGDRLIQNTCRRICEVYDHSPVYRIGGDEFVILLRGRDYDERETLLEKLGQDNEPIYDMLLLSEGKACFAYGMSILTPKDRDFADVFDRADRNMYECKKNMKARR